MMHTKRLHEANFVQISIVLALAACLPGCPPTTAGPEPTDTPPGTPPGDATLLRDFVLPVPLFSSGSAWNQKADAAAVLPESDQQILVTYRVLLGDGSSLSFPTSTFWLVSPFVNFDAFSIPVFRAGQGQQNVALGDYDGNPGSTNGNLTPNPDNTVTVPAPAGAVRPSGVDTEEGENPLDADGHLVLYNPETFMAYDFWVATTARDAAGNSLGGGQTGTTIFEAGVIDVSDVRGSGANPPTFFSTRATGPPLLAGLILPEDVESGAIAHALALAIPGPRNTNLTDPEEPFSTDYFHPASTTEAQFFNSNPLALAAGQRIRLKQTLVDSQGNPIDENQLSPITQMFLAALRTYGAYLVDNAGGFIFYAEDIHTAALNLPDDEVNRLIGQPPGTALAAGKTKWQIAMEGLIEELQQIPIAFGPAGQAPATATIDVANFEVVEPAAQP